MVMVFTSLYNTAEKSNTETNGPRTLGFTITFSCLSLERPTPEPQHFSPVTQKVLIPNLFLFRHRYEIV